MVFALHKFVINLEIEYFYFFCLTYLFAPCRVGLFGGEPDHLMEQLSAWILRFLLDGLNVRLVDLTNEDVFQERFRAHKFGKKHLSVVGDLRVAGITKICY